MNFDGIENKLLRHARAYGPTEFIDYVENGGDIGTSERKYIVELLRGLPSEMRDKPAKSTAPPRSPKREENEKKVVIELERIMFLWDVNASQAQRMFLNEYTDWNDNTVKNYWRKFRSATKPVEGVSPDGHTTFTHRAVTSIPIQSVYTQLSILAILYGIPQNKGHLAGTDYPGGYKVLGLRPMEF